MKRKKGFTLIELLAVIVILAIIAIIATPIVLNLIKRSRRGAAVDAAYGVRKEAQLLYSTTLMEHPTVFNKITVTFNSDQSEPTIAYDGGVDANGAIQVSSDLKYELDGTKPSNGVITINGDGTITYEDIIINGYYCVIPEQGEITCSETNSGNGGSGNNPGTDPTNPGGNNHGTDPTPDSNAECPTPAVVISPSNDTWSYAKTANIYYGTTECAGAYSKDGGEWTEGNSVVFDANGMVRARNHSTNNNDYYSAVTNVSKIDHVMPTATLNMTYLGNPLTPGSVIAGSVTINLSCTAGESGVQSYYIYVKDGAGNVKASANAATLTFNPVTDNYNASAILITGYCMNGASVVSQPASEILFYGPTEYTGYDPTNPTGDDGSSYVYDYNCNMPYSFTCSEVASGSRTFTVTEICTNDKTNYCNQIISTCTNACESAKAQCNERYRQSCREGCNQMPLDDDTRAGCLGVCETLTVPPCETPCTCSCPESVQKIDANSYSC